MPQDILGRAVVFLLLANPTLSAAAFGPLLTSSNLGSGTNAVSNVMAWDPVRGGWLGMYAATNGLSHVQGLVFGPDGNLYAASEQTGQILRFQAKTGKFLGIFATVQSPVGLTFGPDGDLYVVSNNPDGVVRCNGTTGSGCAVFASPAGNLMSSPFMAIFGPDGNLYVASTFNSTSVTAGGAVLQFNGVTGEFQKVFASDPSLGGPTGILFTTDGSLLVSDLLFSQILKFNGTTGTLSGTFATRGPLNGPSQLLAGPGGDIYVANSFAYNVLRYDSSGNYIDTIIPSTSIGPGAVNFLAFAPALPQPAISSNGIVNGIVNAASFAGGAVSPGEILTLFGTNMGPSRGFIYQIDSTGKIAGYTAGTRVLFDGVAAPVLYAQQNQVSVIAPYGIDGKSQVNIQVEYLGQPSLAISTPVAVTTPGIFTAAQNGTGQGAILLADGHTANDSSHPAPRGSIVSIFATGAGQTNPTGVDGEFAPSPAPAPAQTVNVKIGGQDAEVVYVGGSPGSVEGLLQINVVVPQNIPTGNVPVSISIGQGQGQTGVTLAVN
jgi:uncharacterized protein (TIGR03437 family)